MEKVYLTTVEAAERIGFNENSLRHMRVKGNGPPFSKLGRSVRYAAADIDAWVRAGSRNSTSEQAAA